jgi:predicted nucleic-acid-binding Zn-ribbon protein
LAMQLDILRQHVTTPMQVSSQIHRQTWFHIARIECSYTDFYFDISTRTPDPTNLKPSVSPHLH